MQNEIIIKDWDGKCPICGNADLIHADINYEICDNCWVVETLRCENCGQTVKAEYSLTFECVSYKSTAPVV